MINSRWKREIGRAASKMRGSRVRTCAVRVPRGENSSASSFGEVERGTKLPPDSGYYQAAYCQNARTAFAETVAKLLAEVFRRKWILIPSRRFPIEESFP